MRINNYYFNKKKKNSGVTCLAMHIYLLHDTKSMLYCQWKINSLEYNNKVIKIFIGIQKDTYMHGMSFPATCHTICKYSSCSYNGSNNI